MNLFEIMQSAAGGRGLDSLGARYGLPLDRVGKVMEAFLPAFSAGLKRAAAEPPSLFDLMRQLAAGNYTTYFSNPGQRGIADGQDIVAMLFGSDPVRRGVLDQATAFTGIGRDTLERMLPDFAATLFGGLQQQMMTAANPWLAATMSQPTSGQGRSRPAASNAADAKGPLDRYEDEQEATAKREAAENPLVHMQSEGMRSTLAAMEAGGAAWTDAMRRFTEGAMPSADPGKAGGASPFGDMFEPGLAFSDAYQRNLAGLFGQSGKVPSS